MSTILGVSVLPQDSWAAVLQGGRLRSAVCQREVAAASHHKAYAFPQQAAQRACWSAGIGVDEVDAVAIAFAPSPLPLEAIRNNLITNPKKGAVQWLRRGRAMLERYAGISRPRLRSSVARLGLQADKVSIEKWSADLAMLASGFYPSPYGEALLVSLGGASGGTALATARSGTIDLCSANSSQSIVTILAAFSNYLGCGTYHYREMEAMARYGEPVFCDQLISLLGANVAEDGSLRLNNKQVYEYDAQGFVTVRQRVIDQIGMTPGGIARKEEEGHEKWRGYLASLDTDYGEYVEAHLGHMIDPPDKPVVDLCASVYEMCARLAVQQCKTLARWHKHKAMCLVGDVAALPSIVSRVEEALSPMEVMASPYFSGCSAAMGAALLHYHTTLRQPRVIRSRHFDTDKLCGFATSSSAAHVLLRASSLPFQTRDENVFQEVAQALAHDKLVAWFEEVPQAGRQYALSRCILAAPGNSGAAARLNLEVKKRNSAQKFDVVALDHPSLTNLIRRPPAKGQVRCCAMRAQLPAIDSPSGHSTVLTIDEKLHGDLSRLLEAYLKLTGRPILAHTALCYEDSMPVVTAQQACEIFKSTPIDIMVLGDFVLSRSPAAEEGFAAAAAPPDWQGEQNVLRAAG